MIKIDDMELDIETFSDRDIKNGVYRYSESSVFDILVMTVFINGEFYAVYDIASGDHVPDEIVRAVASEEITKWAHNASFERICLSLWIRKNYPQYFKSYGPPGDTVGNYLNPKSWKCSMTLAAYNGLPLSLADVGSILELEQQKLDCGKDGIRLFCKPVKPTKANGFRTRNLPSDLPEKWAEFKQYNFVDVAVEMAIINRLRKYPVPDFVWEEYHMSEMINDRGILVDPVLVGNAIKLDEISHNALSAEMIEKTGLENPNSPAQLKEWLKTKGIVVDSLGKKEVEKLIETAPSDVADVLRLRQQIAKSSVKKYQAMQNSACEDGRCRGLFQFYGANRTGRFAGRNIQLQNLPQNHLPDLKQARELVKQGDYEMVKALYGNVPKVLSELIRTALIPKPGYQYVVSDFSAIEARVLSFLAGEKWRMDVFANNGDIYCASASQMFHVPVEKHGVNSHLRQKGKIAELALGYGGGVGAMKSMGALDMGLTEEELQPIVDRWRASNPNITRYWWKIDAAVKKTVKQHLPSEVGCIRFEWKSNMLFIWLPSGRRLSYVKPKMCLNQFGSESVCYMGTDNQKHWSRIESYGPKFVENIVQAVSRDILCYAIRNLSDRFIVGHVHDEVIIECPPDVSYQEICDLMGQAPPWLPGICLRADGYTTEFYRKD